MREDFWTLSIIPHCGRAPRVYRVSRWHLYFAVALGGLVLMTLFLLGYSHLRFSAGERDYRRVMLENEALKGRLSEMESRVVSFEEKMGRMTSADERFREIAGLAGISPEVRDLGTGGAGRPAGRHGDGAWLRETTGLRIEATEEALERLNLRADQVYQSLVETVDQMEYNQEKFTRTPSIWPTDGSISSRFGERRHPIYGGVRPHNGVDIYAGKGTPIRATADGKVVRAGWEVGYGLSMVVEHGYGFRTFYAHCSKLKKKVGDTVRRGDIIALVGNTGITTGTHLHYEVLVDGKSVNPANYILGDAVPD